MIITPYLQHVALKRELRAKYRVTIKDALKRLETVNNNLLEKRMKKDNVAIDNMLRLTDIEKCNKILKSMGEVR